MNQYVTHTLKPIFDKTSQVLLLGTMPSPKSREYGFYYSHPQNRFWRVISTILGEPIPQNNSEKEIMLLSHHIALWDVLESCIIKGADDNSIKEPIVNDINLILKNANVKAIFTTGTKSTELYKRFCLEQTGIPSIRLSSTSPANCRNCNLESLIDEYKVILDYLN